MTVEKPKPKQLLRASRQRDEPITIPHNYCTCNSLVAREKSHIHGVIGFDSHWLKNWHNPFKRSNRNHIITFDSHLKTALTSCNL